jgi:hypothetical protein
LEIPIRFLSPDPPQERLELRRRAERFEAVEAAVQFLVRVRRVKLLVARLAQGGTVVRLAAALAGLEVMERDQVSGDEALAERARFETGGRSDGHHERS